eukprot:TRINITY_DN37187_c0_g1_i1.p2 TRINITY_DN37187_c0_g1~~TRINITY_DN37187_c0_g1_i1.p2  ORF type:complete len:112 (-),score=15.62 TRINITY_DN37187_c0_g1_i1:18-353(-)
MSEAMGDNRPRDKIQVSSLKRPGFYANLAKSYLETVPRIEISGLGQAIPNCVTVAESLRASGSVEIEKIETSQQEMTAEGSTTPIMKPRIAIQIARKQEGDRQVPSLTMKR